MTKKELNAKLEVLEDNGIVSDAFLHTIGLVNDWNIGNGRKVKCYRNYYSATRIPPDIQNYIDKGYMECIRKGDKEHFWYFKVTDNGFAWLSKLLGIKVEELE